MKNPIHFLLSFSLILISCAKTNAPVPETQYSKCFLIKVATTISSGTSIITDYIFVSDKVSSMSTLTTNAGGSTTETHIYTYNQNGTIAKYEGVNHYDNYFYNSDNKTIKIESYNKPSDTLLYASNYEYNASGQVIKFLYSAGFLVYEYTNTSTKNASKVKSYNSKDVLEFAFTYEYDDKKSPSRDNWLDAFSRSENNITKILQQNISKNTTTTTLFNYEYNASGYPTKLTKTTEGSSIETTDIYTYNCK
jgi:hypothetical protein